MSDLDETDSRLEDFLLKMEKKKQNVRGAVANTTLEAKTTIKGEWHTCNAATHLAITVYVTPTFSLCRHSTSDGSKACQDIQKSPHRES